MRSPGCACGWLRRFEEGRSPSSAGSSGHSRRWWPFSLLAHPQYVGTVLTIWGLFLALRFPHDDSYALPVIETLYYAAATWLESPGEPVQSLRKTMAPM